VEDVINAFMVKYPNIDGIYVTWAEPAEFVLAALRNNGNTHTKVVTLDLSEPLALDMVKGGNVAAIVADEAYGIGATLARASAAGLLKKELPPFVAVDAIAITKDNLREGWYKSLHRDPPATLSEQQ
jgi:ribose transport system substrate-binding protein